MADRELILLALDASPSLSLMERALRAAGFEVAVVYEYAGLTQALEEGSPALLLIGESFDGKNGIDIAVSQLDRFPTLPVLLYSEKDTTGIVKAVLNAGLSGYLHPPLRTDDIVEAVRRSLARARHLGDWVRREVRLTTASLEHRARISEDEKVRLESIFSSIEDGVIVLDDAKRFILINRVAREPVHIDIAAELPAMDESAVDERIRGRGHEHQHAGGHEE